LMVMLNEGIIKVCSSFYIMATLRRWVFLRHRARFFETIG